MMQRHICARHGLSPDKYLQRWGSSSLSADGFGLLRATLDAGESARPRT
jgi:hypothetical protein